MENSFNTNVKGKANDALKLLIKLFKTITDFCWSICLLVWECFGYVAYKRLLIPKVSLLLELLIFIVPCLFISLYCISKQRMVEDREGKELYRVSQEYQDSLIKVEIKGWARGRREVLDSLERTKPIEKPVYRANVKEELPKETQNSEISKSNAAILDAKPEVTTGEKE